MKKPRLLLALILLTGTQSISYTQDQMDVNFSNSTESGHAIENIQTLRFIGPNLQINKTDGTSEMIPLSGVKTLDFEQVLSTTGEKESSLLTNLFPNPVSGNTLTVKFELAAGGPVVIEFLDGKGAAVKEVKSQGTAGWNEVNCDLSGLASGSYSCTISLDGKRAATKKIIKQ